MKFEHFHIKHIKDKLTNALKYCDKVHVMFKSLVRDTHLTIKVQLSTYIKVTL